MIQGCFPWVSNIFYYNTEFSLSSSKAKECSRQLITEIEHSESFELRSETSRAFIRSNQSTDISQFDNLSFQNCELLVPYASDNLSISDFFCEKFLTCSETENSEEDNFFLDWKNMM